MAEGQPVEGDPVGKGTTWFFVGQNDFEELEIRPAGGNSNFYYFYHKARGELIKEFVLEEMPQTRRLCSINLIKTDDHFTPRLTIWIQNKSNKSIKEVDLPIKDGETRRVKARVDLSRCHENFWSLVRFLESFDNIALPTGAFSVIDAEGAELLRSIQKASKSQVISALLERWPEGVDEDDLAMLAQRKRALARFESLLEDSALVEARRLELGSNKRVEDVWQDFFQANQWIFGYGLELVSCEAVDADKMETIVAGSDFFGGPGKRIDALLKTRGHVGSMLFCEIKRPDQDLLMKQEYRPSVFSPAEHLRGGVAQVQKTVHAVELSITKHYHNVLERDGTPTGEVISVVRPQGVVVVGSLGEFETEHGVNFARFSSFELYRQSLHGVSVITFDELLERTRFIVGHLVPVEGDTETDSG